LDCNTNSYHELVVDVDSEEFCFLQQYCDDCRDNRQEAERLCDDYTHAMTPLLGTMLACVRYTGHYFGC
jgi:hypothetical protein